MGGGCDSSEVVDESSLCRYVFFSFFFLFFFFNDTATTEIYTLSLHDALPIYWHMGFNGMEVVNSGATQTDAMQLFRDWMTLLNRGYTVTPVGSSDSHDVARHFVGQGRTYIRCQDSDPGKIDIEEATRSFIQGRVMVSYGLLATMTINGKYGPGELVRLDDRDQIDVDLRVLGPDWVQADTITLFANGQPIRSESIKKSAGDRLPIHRKSVV